MVVMYSWQNGREGRNGGSGYHLLSASSFDNTSITSFSLNEGSSDVNSATLGASSSSETHGFYDTVHAIIRRMILHEFCKSWKKSPSSLFVQLLHMASSLTWDDKSTYHTVHFVAAVFEDLLDEIDRSPRLPFAQSFRAFSSSETSESNATTNTLRNFGTFLSEVIKRLEISAAENALVCDNFAGIDIALSGGHKTSCCL